jgi:hypothetical protein
MKNTDMPWLNELNKTGVVEYKFWWKLICSMNEIHQI